MKTKRFDFDWHPLQQQLSISVEGGQSAHQTYDASLAEYSPDYSIVPLILQPSFGVIDKDGIIPSGNKNAELANIKWYEIIDGERQLIATDNRNYKIVGANGTTTYVNSTGDTITQELSSSWAGRIYVYKNAAVAHPITLEFNAEYVDPRNQQIINIMLTTQIKCTNSTSVSTLVLDVADQTIFNPFLDDNVHHVHARLVIGGQDVPDENVLFVWELLRDNGDWETAGADETMDYHISISSDTKTLTIDKSLMGELCQIRCRAKYDAGGDAASKLLSAASPFKIVSFVRRIPKFEYDMFEVPENIPQVSNIYPRAMVWNSKGNISDYEKELMPLWYMATNVIDGNPAQASYVQVGNGASPTIPTAMISQRYGGVLALDMVDIGAIGAWEDGDGKVLTFTDNNTEKVLLIH